MYGDKTFDLLDLNEDVWNKVVAFFITHSSGLGGPGALWLITEDKKEYCLVFEGLPFSEYELDDNLHPSDADVIIDREGNMARIGELNEEPDPNILTDQDDPNAAGDNFEGPIMYDV